jgi:hypothetical protein
MNVTAIAIAAVGIPTWAATIYVIYLAAVSALGLIP